VIGIRRFGKHAHGCEHRFEKWWIAQAEWRRQ
jgi:hypothetical protein